MDNINPDYLSDLERQFWEAERALSSLELFRAYMSKSEHNDFVFPHQAHHRVVAHHLERVVRGEINRLMVCLPPGTAKSTIVSVQFACWWWA